MVEEILEVCKVTPSLGSPTDICLPLTFFDLLWLKFPPVELLFFYDFPFDPDTFFSSIIPRLKHSLSLTLQHFLPVAGNLIWKPSSFNPIIYYKKGDGILLAIAQSDGDFFHLSSNNYHESNIYQPFKAKINISPSQASLFAIKATLFPHKGFCIGITEHHTVFDGKSFTMFFNTWASLSKFGEIRNLNPEWKPIFERKSVRESYSGLEIFYIDAFMKQNRANPRSLSTCKSKSPTNNVIGTFQLSGSDVKRLKKFVRARFGNQKHTDINQDFYISTFAITFAYLLICLGRAKQLAENVCFSIVIDCRAWLKPPIPANYFGNSIGFAYGNIERENLTRDDGILDVVLAINRTMKKFKDDGVLKEAEKWLLLDTLEEGEENESESRITFTGSNKLEFYNVDFGWGKLRKYFASTIESGSFGLVEGKDGDGTVEIELCLKKDEMEKFASSFAEGLTKINPVTAAL